VQFEDEVTGGGVVPRSDHRQAAAQLVVPDAALVHLRSLKIQVELEPVRTPVVLQSTDRQNAIWPLLRTKAYAGFFLAVMPVEKR